MLRRNGISWATIHPAALSKLISRASRSLVFALISILAVPQVAEAFDKGIHTSQIPDWLKVMVPASSVILSALTSFAAAHFGDPTSTTFTKPASGYPTVPTLDAPPAQPPDPEPEDEQVPAPVTVPALVLPPAEPPVNNDGWNLDDLPPGEIPVGLIATDES